MDEVRDSAIKYAVLNAYQHEGEAQTGSVIGRIMAEFPELRSRAQKIVPIIDEAVCEVNSWSVDKQENMLLEKWPHLLESDKDEEEKTLPPLENVERFPIVKTRFAPNPDGALHLGSAEPMIFCDEYAKMYDGHFILRYEDTSSDVKPPIPKMYDWIMEDLEWLGVNVHERYYQSDRVSLYHDYAEKLLEMGGAYICTCNQESFKELYMDMKPCPCRSVSTKENIERWGKMLKGEYERGDAVVRIKTDIEHPNPAIRDWPALRISNAPHPRVGTKYHVWPLYNFSCAIDDHLMEVSHIIRGKEHDVNTTRQRYIYRYFGWAYPEIINVGRLGLEDAILSKSRIRRGIEEGTYSGWDDPRLGTLRALRKRGLRPETIRKLMIEIGPKPINVMLSWDNIAAENRKMIDPIANRYTFIHNPISLRVTDIRAGPEAHLPRHPDFPNRGTRDYKIQAKDGLAMFMIPGDDVKNLETGKLIRLMGLMNIEVLEIKKGEVVAMYQSRDYQEARDRDLPFINWLPADTGVKAAVVMPDASIAEGLASPDVATLEPDDIIQFERFGFVRIDRKKPLLAYFTHS
ncbi:MAG: glutamate--tRNA ligase [Candidatus Bathyarchaeia archaeon]